MSQDNYSLVQANFAYWKDDVPSIFMQSFIGQANAIHELVEKSPGFVWRYSSDDVVDMHVAKIFGSKKIIFNMSVWHSLEDLKSFSFTGIHLSAMKQKTDWFDEIRGRGSVLWWIDKSKTPTVEQAKEKLDLLAEKGPTVDAFTFGKLFEPISQNDEVLG